MELIKAGLIQREVWIVCLPEPGTGAPSVCTANVVED